MVVNDQVYRATLELVNRLGGDYHLIFIGIIIIISQPFSLSRSAGESYYNWIWLIAIEYLFGGSARRFLEALRNDHFTLRYFAITHEVLKLA